VEEEEQSPEMAIRHQKPPLPRTLPLLALPSGQVARLHRAAFERLRERLAAAQCLPPDSPVPRLASAAVPQAAKAGGPAVLLFVPANDLLPSVLEQHFAPHAWRILLAHQPHQAASILRESDVRLAILDFALPGAQNLLVGLKLAPTTNGLPTVALFPHGHDPEHPAELRIRADVELSEPFEFARLLAVAQTQLDRANPPAEPAQMPPKGGPPASGSEPASAPPSADFHLRLILPSTHEELDRATDLATVLFRHSGLDPLSQQHLLAACREAVGNAIQHGNRRDPTKAVRAEYHQDAAQVTLTVEDEGPGFDHHRFLQQAVEKEAVEAARRRHQEGGHGGLGILMIQRFADHLEFNEAGNAITFSKLIHPPEGGQGTRDEGRGSREDARQPQSVPVAPSPDGAAPPA
jgi:anti-sigma regulatory factor (Ser/Thr protein kinase)